MRSTLLSWENSLVNLFAELTVMGDENCATRTAKRFMGREADNVSNPDW